MCNKTQARNSYSDWSLSCVSSLCLVASSTGCVCPPLWDDFVEGQFWSVPDGSCFWLALGPSPWVLPHNCPHLLQSQHMTLASDFPSQIRKIQRQLIAFLYVYENCQKAAQYRMKSVCFVAAAMGSRDNSATCQLFDLGQ